MLHTEKQKKIQRQNMKRNKNRKIRATKDIQRPNIKWKQKPGEVQKLLFQSRQKEKQTEKDKTHDGWT
jgi:hypothetical protein